MLINVITAISISDSTQRAVSHDDDDVDEM